MWYCDKITRMLYEYIAFFFLKNQLVLMLYTFLNWIKVHRHQCRFTLGLLTLMWWTLSLGTCEVTLVRLETARHHNRKWSGTEINGLAVWDRNKRCLLTCCCCCCCCPKDDSFGDITKAKPAVYFSELNLKNQLTDGLAWQNF